MQTGATARRRHNIQPAIHILTRSELPAVAPFTHSLWTTWESLRRAPSCSITVPPGPISVVVQPNPSGRSFSVDGIPYSTAQTFNWIPSSSHTIATTATQNENADIRYVW